MAQCAGYLCDGSISLHTAGLSDYEAAKSARRTHHQQWVAFRTYPRPHSAPYTAAKHAITGLTKATALDGRPFAINCGQIDIGNAATEMTDRMKNGVLQANGTLAVEPTIDVDHAARAVLYLANLPLDVNVPYITVMATQMPFMGRG